MRKILFATVALAAFALATPASAQIYFGPDGIRIGPLYVPNPDYYPPPPPQVYQPPPVVVQPPPVVVQPPPVVVQPVGNCVTSSWDGYVNVRAQPNGVPLTVLPNGVPVMAFGNEPSYVDWAGYTWVHVAVNGLNGWSLRSSLNCGNG
jgi:hypothetical protein